MSDRINPPKNKLISRLIIVAICAAAAYFVWRSMVPPAPTMLSQSSPGMTSAEFAEGAWYWIEGADTPQSHLVRAVGSTVTKMNSTEQIRSYSVGHGKIAWSAGDGKSWSISIAGIDGSGKAGIWSGDHEPTGLYLADDRLYWMEQIPALVPDSGPMPPLGPQLRVVSSPLTGGAAPTAIGSIMEAEGLKILGIHDGRLYASAQRGALKQITTVYELGLKAGTSQRIVAEVGDHSTLLLPDGTLYWTSASREASDPEKVICVWKRGNDGKPVPIQDWLPHGGRLYSTAAGVCYVDGGYSASAWPIGAPGTLPQSLPLPAGFMAVAVGNGEVLLRPSYSSAKTAPIYRVPLP